jgi:hypothetical protein
VRILAEERFLVPHEESRRALRQIARDTRSSYARVAQYDKQLGQAIRCHLLDDPEFRELQRVARARPEGGDVPIDEELERGLIVAGTDEFFRRFSRADPARRGQIINTLLGMSHSDVEGMIRKQFAGLPVGKREQLLSEVQSSPKHR